MKNLNFDSYTDILLKTRERLTDPKNWCGDSEMNGDDEKGGLCIINMGYAVCEEHYGVLHEQCFDTWHDIVKSWRKIIGFGEIPEWNDTHTHEEVLELLDTAIAQRMQIAA